MTKNINISKVGESTAHPGGIVPYDIQIVEAQIVYVLAPNKKPVAFSNVTRSDGTARSTPRQTDASSSTTVISSSETGSSPLATKPYNDSETNPAKYQMALKLSQASSGFGARVLSNYVQLIKPSPVIACTPGLCLVYVRETYGIGPKYPTATAGWNASRYRHLDHDYPADTWVPLWFSLSDNPDGHVVLRQPDGSIWSSSHPTSTTPMHHSSLNDLEKYYKGRLTYLGWTEDIEDVRVVSAS